MSITARHYAALLVIMILCCLKCSAEAAEPVSVCHSLRSGTGPARKCDAGADDVSGRGANHAAAQQPLPAMGHGTGIHLIQARVEPVSAREALGVLFPGRVSLAPAFDRAAGSSEIHRSQ